MTVRRVWYNEIMPGGSGQKTHKTRQIAAKSAVNSSDGSNSGLSKLQLAVVELYGRGLKKKQVLDVLLDHLEPQRDPEVPIDVRRKRARVKLRRWERTQEFRDHLFSVAVADVDLASKDILRGVTARAKEGNVDAAKFALEVAGRYTPRGDPTPPVVTVNFGFLPRPARRAEELAIEGEAEEEPEA